MVYRVGPDTGRNGLLRRFHQASEWIVVSVPSLITIVYRVGPITHRNGLSCQSHHASQWFIVSVPSRIAMVYRTMAAGETGKHCLRNKKQPACEKYSRTRKHSCQNKHKTIVMHKCATRSNLQDRGHNYANLNISIFAQVNYSPTEMSTLRWMGSAVGNTLHWVLSAVTNTLRLVVSAEGNTLRLVGSAEGNTLRLVGSAVGNNLRWRGVRWGIIYVGGECGGE